MNHKDICTFMTSMPGIVRTAIGLEVWTKIFGIPIVKEHVHKCGSTIIKAFATQSSPFFHLMLLFNVKHHWCKMLFYCFHGSDYYGVFRDSWVKKMEAASKHYLETEKKKREKAHQGWFADIYFVYCENMFENNQ